MAWIRTVQENKEEMGFWQHERWVCWLLSLLHFAASSFPFLAENSRGKEGDERKV
jgi:hypothetical protein